MFQEVRKLRDSSNCCDYGLGGPVHDMLAAIGGQRPVLGGPMHHTDLKQEKRVDIWKSDSQSNIFGL